jgi:hypothetical protein
VRPGAGWHALLGKEAIVIDGRTALFAAAGLGLAGRLAKARPAYADYK